MVHIAWIIILVLIAPALAQDDNSTVGGFSPLPFVTDPIPDGDYSDHHILPMTFPEAMPPAAQDLCNAYEVWDAGARAWLGVNVSLPKNVTRLNLTIA